MAVIQFRIGKNGKLLETTSCSGNGPAEATAIAAIKKAFPFRPLPESVKAPYLEVRYTFNYRVNDMSEIPLQPAND